MPRPLSMSCPASCTARSRANLSGDSTMIVFAPSVARRCQHLGKAGALIDRIGTAHGCVVELVHDVEPCTSGISLDGSSLTLVAVLVSTDIGRT